MPRLTSLLLLFHRSSCFILEAGEVRVAGGGPISNAWAFVLILSAPGFKPLKRLAWIGYRSNEMRAACGDEPLGPTLFWSVPNPLGLLPRWRRATGSESPGAEEFTYCGDSWVVRRLHESERVGAEELAQKIVEGLVQLLE